MTNPETTRAKTPATLTLTYEEWLDVLYSIIGSYEEIEDGLRNRPDMHEAQRAFDEDNIAALKQLKKKILDQLPKYPFEVLED